MYAFFMRAWKSRARGEAGPAGRVLGKASSFGMGENLACDLKIQKAQ